MANSAFLLAINLKEIGGLYTLTNSLLAIFTLYLGRVVTDKNSHRILVAGTTIHGLTLAVRILFTTIIPISIVQSIGALSWGAVHIPYYSKHYNLAKEKGVAQTIHAREVYLSIGRVLSSVFLIILLLSGIPAMPALMAVILLGAVGTFLMQLLK